MTNPGRRASDRSTVVVICSTVIALAVLGLYAWQSARGIDTSNTLTLVIMTLAAAVPGVANYGRSSAIERKVDTVQQQTNGNQSELISMLRDAQQQLAESIPPRPPLVIPVDAHAVRVDVPAPPADAP